MWFWFGFAVLALIGEAVTGTFYLLLFALGLAAGGVAALLHVAVPGQIVAVALIAFVGLMVLRKTGVLKKAEVNAARNRDVNLDIGQVIQVDSWDDDGSAQVWYRGANWHARLLKGAARETGPQRIVEIQGSTLMVEPSARKQ